MNLLLQGWKLFAIMLILTSIKYDNDIITPSWMLILLEKAPCSIAEITWSIELLIKLFLLIETFKFC